MDSLGPRAVGLENQLTVKVYLVDVIVDIPPRDYLGVEESDDLQVFLGEAVYGEDIRHELKPGEADEP